MPEQSRAAVMLSILKNQYEPEAAALEKTGHAPVEGKEFESSVGVHKTKVQELRKETIATRKYIDPNEWLKRKLAEHGLTPELVLERSEPEKISHPVQQKLKEISKLPESQILPEIKKPKEEKVIGLFKKKLQLKMQPQPKETPKMSEVPMPEKITKREEVPPKEKKLLGLFKVKERQVEKIAQPKLQRSEMPTQQEKRTLVPEIQKSQQELQVKMPPKEKKVLGLFKVREKQVKPEPEKLLQPKEIPKMPERQLQPKLPQPIKQPQPEVQESLEVRVEKEMQRLLQEAQIEPKVPRQPMMPSQPELLSQPEKQLQPEAKKEKKSLRGILYRKLKTEKLPDYPKFAIEQENLAAIVPREEVKDHHVVYPLIKPFAFASIKWDPIDNSMIYSVVEPQLSDEDEHILEKLKEGLIQIINISFEDIRNQHKMLDFLEENIRKLLYEYDFNVDDQRYMNIMYYVFRNFIGLNEIEPLLRDPYIEDVGVDGIGIPVYVVHQRYGSVKTNIIYHNEEKLKEFVTKLAERCDRYISYAEPLLDGTLPDGTRVNASLASDVTTRGPTFSIRKFKETPFTPVDMVKLNTASPEMLAYLWFVIQNNANLLITGGVSTGKTSFLNCLSLFIPPEAKIVSIEDTRELSLPHENWIPGVARVGFTGTGVGEVTMFELLRESFRQNPDYLIVGEIRGKEAYVMFQAMASGHPSMTTMHAGNTDDVIRRLQTHPINLSAGLLEVLDVIIVMVHAREKGKSARRVKEVVELQSIDIDKGRARATKSFVWLPAIDSFEYRGDSWVLHKISDEKGIPMDKIIREIAQRKKLINWMVENNIVAINDIVKYINLYYRDPEKLKNIIN